MTISLSRIFNPRPGWYRGDFHAHTDRSDGALSPRELSALALRQGLDFLAITDHNQLSAFDGLDGLSAPLLLPGVEVTLYEGHFNLYGFDGNTWVARQLFGEVLDLPHAPGEAPSLEHARLEALLEKLAGSGLFLSMNHPRLEPWQWRDPRTRLELFNAVELVNDPTYPDNRQANPAARRLWSAWLSAGLRIAALGGSDFHSPKPWDDPERLSRLDFPYTCVYAENLSCLALLDGLRRRHAYLSCGPSIEFKALLDGREYLPGDDLGKLDSTARLYARVEGCLVPARALLVKDGLPVAESWVYRGVAELEFEVLPGLPGGAWYRFDLLDQEDQTLAITNPFFTGPPRPARELTFGEFI